MSIQIVSSFRRHVLQFRSDPDLSVACSRQGSRSKNLQSAPGRHPELSACPRLGPRRLRIRYYGFR